MKVLKNKSEIRIKKHTGVKSPQLQDKGTVYKNSRVIK